MKLIHFLNNYFGYSTFRPGQREIIEAAINNKNVLGVLATGSGKTLCYQFASEWLEGITVVISPLISLMEDQWTRIRQNGNKRVGILHSGLDKVRYEFEWEQIQRNKRKLIFISPERLNHPQTLKKLSQHMISLLVVDEAHCVSQWGYDFRPDYLLIQETYASLGYPPIMALTGTASPKVQEDIIGRLRMRDVIKVVLTMNRPNIAFYRQSVTDDEEKKVFLLEQISLLAGPGIIYTSTRKKTDQLAEWLTKRLNIQIPAYHAGLSNVDRSIIQTQFINGQAPILVATSAFGMGIDKNDIRFVIHYQFPLSIESYLQEVGRIGRDGKEGVAIILYSKEDITALKSLINYSIPDEVNLKEIISYLQLDKGKKQLKHELFEHMPIKSILYQLRQGGWISGELAVEEIRWEKEMFEKDIDQLVLEWDNLRTERQQNITKFNEIMSSDDCIRKQLLQFLSEYDNKYSSYCCSNCRCNLSFYYGHTFDAFTITSSTDVNWRNELDRLLPINTTS